MKQEIHEKLKAAQTRVRLAIEACAKKHSGGEWEEFNVALKALLQWEREYAALNGEQYASPLDFPILWDTGTPMPQLIVNDHKALLAFYAKGADPEWDGTSVRVQDMEADFISPIALVEFHHCLSAKLGHPNDEVLEGHPLWGRGLDSYSAQEVHNSHWIGELKVINSVHPMHKADWGERLHHYVFWFHDSTFECIARSYSVETFMEPMLEVMQRACIRVLQ